MIRVLIADDSAFMRKVLSDLFRREPDFEVVGTAVNGQDAVDKVKELKPSLLTMDVNMPVMDGLKALSIIMKECPVPVVMISSLTQEGAEATIQALSLGAVDFISKTGGSISRIDPIEGDILEKCRGAATAKVQYLRASPQAKGNEPPKVKRISLPVRKGFSFDDKATPSVETSGKERIGNPFLENKRKNPILERKEKKGTTLNTRFSGNNKKLVVIGTSTGGPQALQSVVTKLPGNLPCGVVIVQHMPAGFTKSLADRLNTISEISVKEAEDGERIKAGWAYIAPGNYHLRVMPDGSGRKIALSQEPPVGNHRPAVNVMFDSAAQFGRDLVAVIMTGMGCDGCEGMKKIKAAGGYSIAQNEETSIVYGMPKAVVEAGLADEVQALPDIAKAIVDAVKK